MKFQTLFYMVFYFYVTKLNVRIVVLLYMQSVVKEKTPVHCLSCKLNSTNVSHGALFLLDITTDKLQTMIIQTSIFDRTFSQKKGSLSLEKQMRLFAANCNYRIFKKLQLQKTCFCHYETDIFLIL